LKTCFKEVQGKKGLKKFCFRDQKKGKKRKGKMMIQMMRMRIRKKIRR